ncbi:hypothetical protein [Flavobacteriaceae bacterium 14752]|uniref:hypothetical protein n=1 Tax=Mesohalobacter salilacus TaxID=2491711 RepID=UPI000F62C3AA|nr:hypothetical protein EIG84_08120 [Flavobacteriaceae bacterium 14752]
MRWLFKPKTTKRLFLLCPIWCLETKLRKEFKDDPYFMTALGGSFSFDQAQIQQIKSLVCQNGIQKICVVANPKCKFIQNIIQPDTIHNTAAEELLANIYHKKYDEIQNETSFEDKCRRLSILHSEFQIAHLRSKPEILALIEHYNLDISIIVNHIPEIHKTNR